MPDSVAIVSGGMDSVTMLHQMVKVERLQPAVITFIYGQKHDKEIAYAKVQAELLGCTDHLVLDLSLLRPLFAGSALVSDELDVPHVDTVMGDPQPATYVPNRNMIFLALAAAYAETNGVTDVYYGAQSHDMYGYWDTTAEFLGQLNQVYGLNRKQAIQIKAPLVNYSKTDILRLGLELEVDYGQTWSCYEGQEVACSRCPTCAERLKAFENVGIVDPLPYVSGDHPINTVHAG
jgi:7-cyano-7-deazaguanine synthase